ncbi:MAG: hypothetical protein ACU0CO_03195 [Shimia sp.]
MYDTIQTGDRPLGLYGEEQAIFARMQEAQARRARRKWRLRLALWIAGAKR